MSCCQNANAQNKLLRMENFQLLNPNDYDIQSQTYTIDGKAYYAPPWPAERTKFDMGLQGQFNTAGIPDFLNYSSDDQVQPKPVQPKPVTPMMPTFAPVMPPIPPMMPTFAPVMPEEQSAMNVRGQKINRKSIFTGRYDSYSY
jgi:hypothetical protein